jgi:hypothetical protein
MRLSTTQIFKVCSLSMALLGSVAVVAAVAMPDFAYAKSGNGNGNGNGGDKGNGKGGDKGNGKGGDKGNRAGNRNGGQGWSKKSGANAANVAAVDEEVEEDVVVIKRAKTFKTKKKDHAGETGAHPSELGALNAAHAAPNALANANPNSRVGRIAAFRDAVLAGQELQGDLDEKSALLDSLAPPDRPLTEIESDLALAERDVESKAATVADLEKALADAGGSDPEIERDLADARAALESAEMTADDLRTEQVAAREYETLSTEVDELTRQLEDQPELERSLLEDAANKPVTDEVEEAVEALLGL